jgi:enoyl-CoA hydratase
VGISHEIVDGIAEIVVDYPPVNAIPVAGWFELAEVITAAGNNPDTRAVILRAEGRGFNAGVDIKEMQDTEGFDALLGANRGCWESFKAVYECKVPVITAAHGYCVGGGIGLAGNSDIIIAGTGTKFALPEVDRGALGAATHLARLVPPLKMRAMVLTCEPATAEELHAWGSVYAVVEPDQYQEDPGRRARGEGVPEQHRPGRRESFVPLRAGLHLRAQLGRRSRRSSGRVRRKARP